MTENMVNEVNELSEEFIIVSKKQSDIIEELCYENEDDRIICDTIISNLEKDVADSIRDMKAAQIPLIGCVRINPVQRELRDNKKSFGLARKYMTKEDYKDHVRSYVIDLKEKQKEKDKEKWILTRTKRRNKKKYESLYKRLGKTYAELWIKSILWLREVPFDKDWEDKYQELKNN